jgi:hypothetical protein
MRWLQSSVAFVFSRAAMMSPISSCRRQASSSEKEASRGSSMQPASFCNGQSETAMWPSRVA